MNPEKDLWAPKREVHFGAYLRAVSILEAGATGATVSAHFYGINGRADASHLTAMKSLKSLVALVALIAAGVAFAAEKSESKVAGCCAKAAKDGKTCTHACCVEAAKAGNNCTKCGGSGKIQTKTETKK